MTLYLLAALFLGLCGLIWWAYRAGGKGQRVDSLQGAQDQAMEAAKIDERIDTMSDADRRAELAKRVRDRR